MNFIIRARRPCPYSFIQEGQLVSLHLESTLRYLVLNEPRITILILK